MTGQPRILCLFGSAVLFGQERGNIEALAALKQQGCSVLCVVRDEEWSVQVPAALDARGLRWIKAPYVDQRLPGRRVRVIARNAVAFLRANLRLFRVVRAFRPTHIHAFNQLYVLNFLVALMIVRCPIVFRAGDEPTLHNWLWRVVWRFIVRRSRVFVANSRFVASALHTHGVSADRIAVIYNPPPRRNGAKKSIDLGREVARPRIAYVGQISEHKGVHVLVEAFRTIRDSHPDAELVLAGRISQWSGDAWARELRDRTTSDPDLAPAVVFLGEIDEIPALLEQSTVHVAPSLFEDPSPNVVMEAKQAARPSVVFARGGMPELVRDGVDGVVCRDATAMSLAEALSRYLGDPQLAVRHGNAAYQSLESFGLGSFARRWLTIYAELRPDLAVDFQAIHLSRP